MLFSVNRDHWNERLNFTGGAMILKPFPPVVISIILLFLDPKDWLSKPQIKTQKNKERTWQIPTAKPSYVSLRSVKKKSNTVRSLSMEIKKNDKKNCQEAYTYYWKKAPMFQAILWPRSHVSVVIWGSGWG